MDTLLYKIESIKCIDNGYIPKAASHPFSSTTTIDLRESQYPYASKIRFSEQNVNQL